MTHRSRVLVYLAVVLACTPGSGRAQADALTHDPFARPAHLKATPPPGVQPRDNVAGGAFPEAAWKPVLTAIMLAGPKSAVSIDGRMLRIGEQIDGHRLVEVREQAAVFVKNGKRVTLSLRDMELAPAAAPARKEERAIIGIPGAPPKQDAPPGTERKPEEK